MSAITASSKRLRSTRGSGICSAFKRLVEDLFDLAPDACRIDLQPGIEFRNHSLQQSPAQLPKIRSERRHDLRLRIRLDRHHDGILDNGLVDRFGREMLRNAVKSRNSLASSQSDIAWLSDPG